MPQPRNNSGDSGGELDVIIFPLVLVATVCLLGWAIWMGSHTAIIRMLFSVVAWISKIARHVPALYPKEISQNFSNWATTLPHADPSRYGWPAAHIMIGVVAYTLSLFFGPMMVLRIWGVRRAHIVNRFVRRFDLQMLAKLNADHYAAIPPILKENLLKLPLHEGPWAMARSPLDWTLEQQLIYVEKKATGRASLQRLLGLKQNEGSTTKRILIKGWSEKKMSWSVKERRRVLPPPHLCRLSIELTDRALAEQLGPPWTGLTELDSFQQCVLAILLTGICRGLPDARKLALRLSQSFNRLDKKGRHNPTIDTKGIDAICKRYLRDPRVREVVAKHAFTTTVFMGLLEKCWGRGVFITPEFIWLKPVNRTLYFSLNSMGGDRPLTEGAGPWAHYLVEKKKGLAVKVPCIEAGTDAIHAMLFDEEWIGSDEGLASDIEEKRSQEGISPTDEASPTAKV